MTQIFVIKRHLWTGEFEMLIACKTQNEAVQYIRNMFPAVSFTVEQDSECTWDVVGDDKSYYEITAVKLI